MGVVVTAAAALLASYLIGRLRPWQRLGDWAADQVRFTGPWVRGGAARQAVVVLVHSVTAPRRAPAGASCAPRPPRRRRPYAIRTGSPTSPGESASRGQVADSLTGA